MSKRWYIENKIQGLTPLLNMWGSISIVPAHLLEWAQVWVGLQKACILSCGDPSTKLATARAHRPFWDLVLFVSLCLSPPQPPGPLYC